MSSVSLSQSSAIDTTVNVFVFNMFHDMGRVGPTLSARSLRSTGILTVPATGAYCHTMANNYNCNRRVPVVFAAGGAWRVVVRRETWDDLLRRDVD